MIWRNRDVNRTRKVFCAPCPAPSGENILSAGDWVERFDYKEAGPQLLLQAFLQRVVNGGGQITREYGLGRRRTDLLLVWPVDDTEQRIVIELKIKYKSLEETEREGLEQTEWYMDRVTADEGHLIIFNRDPSTPWEEKIYTKSKEMNSHKIQIWGM